MRFWALVTAGLAFVLYFQLLSHFRPIDSAVAATDQHTPPHKATPAKNERPALTFGGYPCPGDCTEDKAGYQWAARNRIRDPDDCTGTTAAFIEGCRVYAERQAQTAPD